MNHVTRLIPKDPDMQYIFRDGKKWVVRYNPRKGTDFNGRYLTLAEAKEARNNEILRQQQETVDG